MMGKETKSSSGDTIRWDFYLVDLISRIGIFGTVVIALLTLFIVRGTKAQHREFIDKFFLMKWNGAICFYHYFIITGLIVLILAQYFHFKQRMKLKDIRLVELIYERDRLQHKLFKKF